MKSIATAQLQPPQESPWGGRVVVGSLRLLFWCAGNAPWAVRIMKWPAGWITFWSSPLVRRGSAANARRIFGPNVSAYQCRVFARRIVARFCEFILSVGTSVTATPEQLRARIESVQGQDAYFNRRQRGGGAIILTAHMGSFEVGLASLAEFEPNVHVVFKRDSFDLFESYRRLLRRKLGIHESPIDDGWSTWLALRDALRANHVVVLQGDRAMPGQKSQSLPVLGGHLRLPVGPFKLALASGSPIIPIFTVMTSASRCKLFVEPPIEVTGDDWSDAIRQWADAIGRFVAKYPDQWLLLTPAFEEDQVDGEVHQ